MNTLPSFVFSFFFDPLIMDFGVEWGKFCAASHSYTPMKTNTSQNLVLDSFLFFALLLIFDFLNYAVDVSELVKSRLSGKHLFSLFLLEGIVVSWVFSRKIRGLYKRWIFLNRCTWWTMFNALLTIFLMPFWARACWHFYWQSLDFCLNFAKSPKILNLSFYGGILKIFFR